MAEVQGDIKLNIEVIDENDVMTTEHADRAAAEQIEIRERNQKKQQEQEERKRKQAKAAEEEKKRKQAEKEEEKKRKQAEEEEEERKKEENMKRIIKQTRKYDEKYDGEKTIFLQMPMAKLFSKTYKLLYIPYTFDDPYTINEEEETREEEPPHHDIEENETNQSSKSSSWFSIFRNYKLTQIRLDQNVITEYNPFELTDKMDEYKNFDVKSLYVRLIFSINKSKNISLYDVFLYYDIYITPHDILIKENGYPLYTFDLYKDDLQKLNERASTFDIADLVKGLPSEEDQNVYYVYIYDIINNNMVFECNITNINNLHNIVNENITK
jgi:hypothetical protein